MKIEDSHFPVTVDLGLVTKEAAQRVPVAFVAERQYKTVKTKDGPLVGLMTLHRGEKEPIAIFCRCSQAGEYQETDAIIWSLNVARQKVQFENPLEMINQTVLEKFKKADELQEGEDRPTERRTPRETKRKEKTAIVVVADNDDDAEEEEEEGDDDEHRDSAEKKRSKKRQKSAPKAAATQTEAAARKQPRAQQEQQLQEQRLHKEAEQQLPNASPAVLHDKIRSIEMVLQALQQHPTTVRQQQAEIVPTPAQMNALSPGAAPPRSTSVHGPPLPYPTSDVVTYYRACARCAHLAHNSLPPCPCACHTACWVSK